MILAIDVGNSSIHYGIMSGPDTVYKQFRCQRDDRKTSDEYQVLIKEQFNSKDIAVDSVKAVVLSSVVPHIERELSLACHALFKTHVISIKPGIKTGLNIRIDDPSELGADLIAAALGAMQSFELPLIIVDLGTATTLSYIDKQGCFNGGIILPGIKTAHDALVQKASKVNDVNFECPKYVVGRSTDAALQSGIFYGHAAMVSGLVRMIADQNKVEPNVVLTGGLATTILDHLDVKASYDPLLIFKGLYAIYLKNS